MIYFWMLLVIFGLVMRQPRCYWLHALCAVLTQVVVQLLFADGDSHARDGFITGYVRNISHDGPVMALFFIPIIGLLWILPVWIVKRGYVPVKVTTVPVNSDGDK